MSQYNRESPCKGRSLKCLDSCEIGVNQMSCYCQGCRSSVLTVEYCTLWFLNSHQYHYLAQQGLTPACKKMALWGRIQSQIQYVFQCVNVSMSIILSYQHLHYTSFSLLWYDSRCWNRPEWVKMMSIGICYKFVGLINYFTYSFQACIKGIWGQLIIHF